MSVKSAVLSWGALLEVLAENVEYDQRLFSDIDNVSTLLAQYILM